MNEIYIISKIWTDSWENQSSNAVGYKDIGFVYTKEEAKIFCDKGRIFTKKDCWAITNELSEFKYNKVIYLE
jgi:hypothetical protein